MYREAISSSALGSRLSLGFTLLELSVVLAIISAVIGGSLVILAATLNAKQYNTTVARMDVIHKALLDYSLSFGRLPCPASLILGPDVANYGVEAASNSNTCTGGTPASTFVAVSGTVEGAVPFRTLRLPEDYLYDGWGRKFRYALDPTYSASNSFPTRIGGPCKASTQSITVKDASGGNRTTEAVYALISHGKNGHGGYTRSGIAINVGSTNVDELTNCHCDDDANATSYSPTYVDKLPGNDPTNLLNSFDDLVTFREAWQLQSPNVALKAVVTFTPQIMSNQYGPAMAQTVDGALMCWGYNGWGQLVNAGSYTYPPSSPVSCLPGHTFTALSVGFNHACGITVSGSLLCWGANQSGQLGNGTTGGTGVNFGPVTVMSGTNFISVSVGSNTSCAVTTVGIGYCWGDNQHGGVGNGTSGNVITTPTVVSGGYTWQYISAGDSDQNPYGASSAETCGVTTDGTGYCWGGTNHAGQAGDGTTDIDRVVPTLVLGGHKWKTITAGPGAYGYSTNCGITTSNEGYCWGSGYPTPDLGNGAIGNSAVPVAISGGYKWSSIVPTFHHVCGITACGDAMCWSGGSDGSNGNGNNSDSSVPVLVAGGFKWSTLSATCGITSTGALMCWGSYFNDNSGGVRTSNVPIPMAVGTTFR